MKPIERSSNKYEALPAWLWCFATVVAFLWCTTVSAYSSRQYFLVNYGSMRSLDAWLEPFGASLCTIVVSMLVMGMWFWMFVQCQYYSRRVAIIGLFYLSMCLVATLVWFFSSKSDSVQFESIWPTFWISAWTGLSFAQITLGKDKSQETNPSFQRSIHWSFGYFWPSVFLSVACGIWWTTQSYAYYDAYMLGFNDFGHFMQRVANTAEGRGWLLETPVLPRFWDHFNPGLLLLVPVWLIYPDVTLCFYLQSIALSGSGVILWLISRRLGHSEETAFAWSAAWLTQPVLGQMNLAYSYGWHPISMAIPLLLAAILMLQLRKSFAAATLLLLALSMEEGVFVIASLFCFVCAAMAYFRNETCISEQFEASFSWKTWLALSIVIAIGFVVVFRWSGLAEFQTARFGNLGGTPVEVLLSPVLRPSVFWGHLINSRNAFFILGVLLPCFAPSTFRAWPILLSVVLPFVVLLVWEHRPAQSLAFQYCSTLLPVIWIASMRGGVSRDTRRTGFRLFAFTPSQSAMGAFATAATLSFFWGQLPYSAETLSDVKSRTYPQVDSSQRLAVGSSEHEFLSGLVALVRSDKSPILATGRIASHCVGNRDVETIGQYLQRKEKLTQLEDRKDNPIQFYSWILLDRLEGFQQSRDEIDKVEREAANAGFIVQEDRFNIALLRRP